MVGKLVCWHGGLIVSAMGLGVGSAGVFGAGIDRGKMKTSARLSYAHECWSCTGKGDVPRLSRRTENIEHVNHTHTRARTYAQLSISHAI